MSTQDDRYDLRSRLADRWIPRELQDDPEAYRRARFAVGAALSPIPAAIFFGIAYAWTVPAPTGLVLAATLLGGIPIYLFSVTLLRQLRTPVAVIGVAVSCGILQLVVLAYLLGGDLSPVLAWAIPVPCVALLVAGRRACLAALLVCAGLMAGFWASEADPGWVPAHYVDDLRFPSLLGMVLFTLGLFALYERTKDGALQTLAQANARLERTRREAHAANQSKGAFLSRMSHEIRTPLMAILGFTDLLADEVGGAQPSRMQAGPGARERQQPVSPDAVAPMRESEDAEAPDAEARRDEAEALATLRRNGEHLLHIIDDLLDLSRIESESLRVTREPVAIRELLEDAVELVRVRAQQRGVALDVALDASLPPVVRSDPTRLRQILVNLLGNAIKFTERGSVALHARPVFGEGPSRLRLEVRDTGIGMTPLQVEQLFRPFGQATPETARIYGGSGLGLAISKRLTEALGGSIQVESRPGVGSTFRVELPLEAEPPAGPDAEVPSSPRRERAEQPLEGRRILVVDDFPDNRVLLARILSRAGASIQLAESGAAALAAVERIEASGSRFDLILMDVQMPGIDGCATTEMLRARGCRSVIVALTADALLSTRERCMRSGFDAHATKPIQRTRLLELARNPQAPPSIALAADARAQAPERGGASQPGRRPARLWQRLTDLCIAPMLRRDRDALRRARIVIGFAATPIPFVAIAVWVFPQVYPDGTGRMLAALFLGVAPLCASVIVLLRIAGSIRWAGTLTLGYVCGLVAITALISGGPRSSVAPWLTVLPIWALPVVGSRGALAWTLAVLGVLGALYAIDSQGLGPGTQLLPDKWALAQFASYTSLMGMLALLGLVYEHDKDDSVERLAHLNAELARARDTADAARQAKERFLATVSHEMRTPMTAILGFSELLHEAWVRHPPASADAMELLSKVEQNGAHLLRLLDDVLDLSRIEAGKLEIETLHVWPAQLLQELLGPVRAYARARGVRLRVRIEGALPETIEADPTRLRQLVTKLLEGAIESAAKGAIVFRIGSARSDGRHELVFTIERKDLDLQGDVHDSWLGIWGSPDEAGGLLPFTLARSLGRLLGGRLEIRNDAHVGDTIVMQLPVVPAAAVAPADSVVQGAGLPGPTRAERALRGARVLLAEDSPDTQRLIAHVLGQVGARLEIAADGRTAVEMALAAPHGDGPFDVVLMDMQMPILDGAQATRLLRAGGYDGAIVALTADRPELARERCLDSGCDDLATKPIDREALFKGLASALARRRARRSLARRSG